MNYFGNSKGFDNMKKLTLRNVAFIVIITIFTYSIVRQQMTMIKINKEIQEKQCELNKAEEQKQKLQDEVDLTKTDAYLEKMARERLGMIKPGEKKIIESGNNNSSNTK